ncbi:MAG: cation transporter [Acidobacteria bacterium]|nr:cation transporter [Acidobacteriota bacterium]
MTKPMDGALKIRAAFFAVLVAFGLFLLKILVGFATHSMSILASGVDSLMDLMASTINFFSIKSAAEPADESHQFGHGKIESLSGLLQGLLIGISALYLAYRSLMRLVHEEPLELVQLGIVTMVVSTLVTIVLVRYMQKVASTTGSLALRADSLHYASDVLTNLGSLLALVLVRWTGQSRIDPVISLVIAGYIFRSAAVVFKNSIDILMDRSLAREVIEEIRSVLQSEPSVRGFHRLRTRQSGTHKFIDLHLSMDPSLTFAEAHELSEEVGRRIKLKIPNSDVTIHADPFGLEEEENI